VDGYALLYEVDESCRTVSVLDVEQEETDSPSMAAELRAANSRH
jgi:mRNA-degrading endonuclease RelE of RelBE toxin-antitoxin system